MNDHAVIYFCREHGRVHHEGPVSQERAERRVLELRNDEFSAVVIRLLGFPPVWNVPIGGNGILGGQVQVRAGTAEQAARLADELLECDVRPSGLARLCGA